MSPQNRSPRPARRTRTLRRSATSLPTRLTLLLVVAALAARADAAPGPNTDPTSVVRSGLAEKLDGLARQAEKDGFHGVVVVIEDGVEILARGYGLANEETKTPFSPATVVPIGSNVKDFTKVAILQLVEAGKLRLEDPISRFFPEAPADKREITLEQILEMRAGFPLGVAADDFPLSKEKFLERLWARPLEFAPGSSERYSNAGFSLLAAIVEQVSGESFDAYLARAILEPLGLRETGLLRPRFDPARLAHGYAEGTDQGTMLDRPRDENGHLWSLRGNGGYLATARDQLTFFRALAGGALLTRPDSRRRLFDPENPVVLAGSDLVSYFLYSRFPGQKLDVVIASNHAEYPAPRLHEAFEEAFGLGPRGREMNRLGREEPAPDTPVTLPTDGPWRTVAAWFDAFRSGDDERVRKFFAEQAEASPDSPPIEKRLENTHRLRRTLGDFVIYKTVRTDQSLDVSVRLPNGDSARLSFTIAPEEPFKLRGIRVEVG